jgi:hypothetical protein
MIRNYVFNWDKPNNAKILDKIHPHFKNIVSFSIRKVSPAYVDYLSAVWIEKRH